ncbi:MAG TPA: aldo/keto reductase [Actinomycetota bacterium]|nr:aldo/keto reductase [Actinomycetota bacterium]
MEHRRIASLNVSVVGLGCNNFGGRIDGKATTRVVHAALDAGINFFDTAELYGSGKSEQLLGRALKGRRDEAVVASKFGFDGDSSPSYIRRAADASLKRLGTGHIDLYQQHRPDRNTPIEDTLGALDELVKAGKVREIGCSEYSPKQISDADDAVRPGAARFVSVQNEYSLLHRHPEGGVLQECRRRGLAFIPYFPLASGLLTGKYRLGQPPPAGSRLDSGWGADRLTRWNLQVVEALFRFAEDRGHSILELAISWLAAQQPVASVIAGATSPEQIRANAGSAGWKLTAEELAAIDHLLAEPAEEIST